MIIIKRHIVLEVKLVTRLMFFLGTCSFFYSCQEVEPNKGSKATLYANYCGSCHLTPNPSGIPKDIWKNTVLPEMAARMGYVYNDYDPYRYKSPLEKTHIELSEKYPKKPIIDSVIWWEIHDYIISKAPNSIPVDTSRSNRNKGLTQFSTRIIDIPELRMPVITSIQFDTVGHYFNVGDATGSLGQWPAKNSEMSNRKFNTGVSSYFKKHQDEYVTEIGILNPSEVPNGILTKKSNGVTDTIVKGLHRPVFMEILDLNEDGVDEVLVCEFGDLTGRLSLFVKNESEYLKKTVHPIAGAIKFEITDMNNDGKKDIIALFSQGNEGIFIFYQTDNFEFRAEQVIQLEPQYGSSWFELLDYDSDGDFDIVMTNGDNADYSIFLKPFHGIRLFLNDGMNKFEQKWFYPIYGATRVLADDYDLDGDIDFAVTALFNDVENPDDKGFVYLENLRSAQFEFQPYTFQNKLENSWLIMSKGDYDSDGDIDIMLGSFEVKGLRKPNSIFAKKEKETAKLMLLENQKNYFLKKNKFNEHS